jgi:hypothetical protein
MYVAHADILDAQDALLLFLYILKHNDEHQVGFKWNINPRRVRNVQDNQNNQNDEEQSDRRNRGGQNEEQGDQNGSIEP